MKVDFPLSAAPRTRSLTWLRASFFASRICLSISLLTDFASDDCEPVKQDAKLDIMAMFALR